MTVLLKATGGLSMIMSGFLEFDPEKSGIEELRSYFQTMLTDEKQDSVWEEILESIGKYKKPNCPVCKKEPLRFAGIVHHDPYQPG